MKHEDLDFLLLLIDSPLFAALRGLLFRWFVQARVRHIGSDCSKNWLFTKVNNLS